MRESTANVWEAVFFGLILSIGILYFFLMMRWDFHGYLDDLIEDIQLAPYPIEVKLFSPDLQWLERTAPRVEEQIKRIPGLIDTFDGLTVSGPAIDLKVRSAEAQRLLQAGHRRLRPVLMTSLAAALGMLPLAYGAGARHRCCSLEPTNPPAHAAVSLLGGGSVIGITQGILAGVP